MMKRFFLLWTVLSGVSLLHADAVLPARWDATGDAVVKRTDDGMTIQSPGKGGGISGVIKNIAGKRFTVSFEARGQGAVRCSIFGSSGWAYGPVRTLSDEWQSYAISYFCTQKSFTCRIFSTTSGATEFAVRNLRVTAAELPEMSEADIAPRRFLPADYPGTNGKIQKVDGAFGGQAVMGKRWHNVMKLPVPANTKPFYYYIHVRQNSNSKSGINLKWGVQNVYSAPIAGAPDQWQWVKIGPVDARALYPECLVNLASDPKTLIWIDQVILATDGNLNDEILKKAE